MEILTVTLNASIDRTVEVPRFAVGGHLRGRLVRAQAAGKGVNVSRCLATLGMPSVATGFVGERELPFFEESFVGTGVRPQFVPIASPTRTNTTILDPEAGTDTHIRELGPRIQPGELEAMRAKLGELARPATLAVFCGSLPRGVGCHELGELMRICTAEGAALAADLNGPQLSTALEAGARFVKPNVAELGELVGRELRPEAEAELVEVASALLDRVETVLVTRGPMGALAVVRQEALACRVEAGKARNTVGCGDAFLAGYLAGLWRGADLASRLKLATACGAAAARSEAAGTMARADVERLVARAEVWPAGRGS